MSLSYTPVYNPAASRAYAIQRDSWINSGRGAKGQTLIPYSRQPILVTAASILEPLLMAWPNFALPRFILSIGDQELYDFLGNNPMVEFYCASYSNWIPLLVREKNLVTINGSVEVDLVGTIASESFGDSMRSGVGEEMELKASVKGLGVEVSYPKQLIEKYFGKDAC